MVLVKIRSFALDSFKYLLDNELPFSLCVLCMELDFPLSYFLKIVLSF